MNSDLLTQLTELITQQQNTITEQDRTIQLLLSLLNKYMTKEELEKIKYDRKL